ncbi:MAG TPA: hypothetical protein VGH91_04685 [Gammaproteobacteria bacterium]|jgi:hypothetical protein
MVSEAKAATIRSAQDRESLREHVFAVHGAQARTELAAEAITKFPAADVALAQVLERLAGSSLRSSALEAALANDQHFEIARLLQGARDEVVNVRRSEYVALHLEGRAWDLFNGGET